MTTKKPAMKKPEVPTIHIEHCSFESKPIPQHEAIIAVAKVSAAWAEAIKALGSGNSYGLYLEGPK